MPSPNTRIEHDLLGGLAVPAETLRTGEGILELIREKHIRTDAQIEEILNPATLTGEGR